MSSATTNPAVGLLDQASQHLVTRLVAVMFTDLVNSTKLKSTLTASEYVNILAKHDRALRKAISSCNGKLQQDTGDGGYAIFESASDAARAALLFQWLMRFDAGDKNSSAPVASRVGVHLGEVATAEEEFRQEGGAKLVGLTVDLAARVMSLASPGQVLLTRDAFNNARQFVAAHPKVPDGSALPPIVWLAHGPFLFQGADEPLEVFEVGAQGFAPLAAPPNSSKAKRFLSPGEEQTLGWRPAVGRPMEKQEHWSISQKLGEGGFGEVWLAEQKKTGAKRVYKFCFDVERLRAMKREVVLFRLLKDALGSRPDIAAIRDWQFDAAPYYIELEYQHDGNLVQWAEAQGGIAKVPLVARLEIVRRVADALAAAHSVGILHKDIKPSNVLMDRDSQGIARPLLGDFGIGILTDKSRLAAHNITPMTVFDQSMIEGNESSRTGTRMYAPPESLMNKPYTMQGDIYSLGVMLYQMAAGDLVRPLATGWERDVPDELLREDIAAAVEGDPTRRLASAAELATRLGTLEQRRAARAEAARIAAEAIAAKERAEEFQLIATRRKKLLTIASALIVLLAVVVSVILVLASQLREQKRKAVADEQIAVEQKRVAVEAKQKAVAAEREAQDATNAFASVITPARSDKNLTVIDAVVNAEKILDEKFPSVEVRDRVRIALGDTLLELGEADQALAVLERVSAKRLAGIDDPDLTTADLFEELAIAEINTDKFHNRQEIFGLLTKAEQIRKQLQPANAPEIGRVESEKAGFEAFQGSMVKGTADFLISALPYFHANSIDDLSSYMFAEVRQAREMMKRGEMDRAVDLFRAVCKPLLDDPRIRRQVPDSVGEMGQYVLARGDIDGAEALGRISVALSADVNGENDPLHGKDMFELGMGLIEHRRNPDGLKFMRDGYNIVRQKIGQSEDMPLQYGAGLVAGLRAMGKTDEAKSLRDQLLALSEDNTPQSMQRRARTLFFLVQNQLRIPPLDAATLQQAEDDSRDAVALADQSYDKHDGYYFYIGLEQEVVLHLAQKYSDAMAAAYQLLQTIIPIYGQADRHVGIVQTRIGMNQLALGQASAAAATLEKAFTLLDSPDGDADAAVEALRDLATAQDATGNRAATENAYRQYLKRCLTAYGEGSENPHTLEAMRLLAVNLAKHSETKAEALTLFNQAIRQSITLLGDQADMTRTLVQSAHDCGFTPTTNTSALTARNSK